MLRAANGGEGIDLSMLHRMLQSPRQVGLGRSQGESLCLFVCRVCVCVCVYVCVYVCVFGISLSMLHRMLQLPCQVGLGRP